MQLKTSNMTMESKLRNLPIYFLSNFGHCGIDYLHSLLDSHKQILIMPTLSFYRYWNMSGCNKVKNTQEMLSIWRIYIEERFKLLIPRKKLFYSREEMERFYSSFKKTLEFSGINRINVFYALHQAYSVAMNIDISHIRALVVHEHLPYQLSEALADFPKAGVLQIIRDPRASMAGSWRQMTKIFGYLSDYYFNFDIEDWMQGFENWKKYSSKPDSKCKVVRNEDLHESLEDQMRNLSDWLGIDFSPTLLKCTFSGRHWEGESAYVTAENKYPQPEEVFFQIENVRKRWMKELAFKEIVMIEFITRKSMKEFGYVRLTGDNLFYRICGFFIFILPHRGLFKRWLKAYPNLEEFKKVSRNLNGKIAKTIWKYLPAPIKFVSIIIHSMLVRIKIYFFPGDRGQRYV